MQRGLDVGLAAYVVRGTRVPVLAHVVGFRVPRISEPSGAVRVADTRVPPVTATSTGLLSFHAVAPAAGLLTTGGPPTTVAVGVAVARSAALAPSSVLTEPATASARDAASSGARDRRASTVGDSGGSRAVGEHDQAVPVAAHSALDP